MVCHLKGLKPQESIPYLDKEFCGLENLTDWYDWHMNSSNGLTRYIEDENSDKV